MRGPSRRSVESVGEHVPDHCAKRGRRALPPSPRRLSPNANRRRTTSSSSVLNALIARLSDWMTSGAPRTIALQSITVSASRRPVGVREVAARASSRNQAWKPSSRLSSTGRASSAAAHAAGLPARDRGEHIAGVPEVPEERAGRDPASAAIWSTVTSSRPRSLEECRPARSMRSDIWIRRVPRRPGSPLHSTAVIARQSTASADERTLAECQDAGRCATTDSDRTGGYGPLTSTNRPPSRAARSGARSAGRSPSGSPSPRWSTAGAGGAGRRADAAVRSTGVTAKEIKVGYIFSKAGLAGSTFENAADGFNARVKAENAKGGVNGRKIVPVIADDSGSTNNLVAAQDLVQNEKVFLVVNNSPFAFLGYRFLLDNGVPMVGGGFDGNEYGQPGNEKLISILGNNARGLRRAVHGRFRRPHEEGGGQERRRRRRTASSASSTAAAKNLQKYPVPDAGLERGLHEHHRRLRHHRRRTARAGHEERRCRCGVPAARAVDEPRNRPNRGAEQPEVQARRARHRVRPGAARPTRRRRRSAPRCSSPRRWAPVEVKDRGHQAVRVRSHEVHELPRRPRLRRLHRLPHRRPHDQGPPGRGEEPHARTASSPRPRDSAPGTPPASGANRST